MRRITEEIGECCIVWIDLVGFVDRCEQIATYSKQSDLDKNRKSVRDEYEAKVKSSLVKDQDTSLIELLEGIVGFISFRSLTRLFILP